MYWLCRDRKYVYRCVSACTYLDCAMGSCINNVRAYRSWASWHSNGKRTKRIIMATTMAHSGHWRYSSRLYRIYFFVKILKSRSRQSRNCISISREVASPRPLEHNGIFFFSIRFRILFLFRAYSIRFVNDSRRSDWIKERMSSDTGSVIAPPRLHSEMISRSNVVAGVEQAPYMRTGTINRLSFCYSGRKTGRGGDRSTTKHHSNVPFAQHEVL